jgi:hypothetical protein
MTPKWLNTRSAKRPNLRPVSDFSVRHYTIPMDN